MKRKFAYLFTIGGHIEWSSETGESLERRLQKHSVKERINLKMFIEHSVPGSFMKISTGEMIFKIA